MESSKGTAAIQLCPWYMEYYRKQFEGGGSVYLSPGVLSKIWDLSTRPPSTLDRPQIDYFRLLDVIILHEVCITAVSCTN
jgi:hypothetical protein